MHTLSRERGTCGWLTGGILAVAQHDQCSKTMPGGGACLGRETGCLLALSRLSHLGSPFCNDVWSMRSGRRGSSSAMISAQAKRRRELCATLLRLSEMSLTSRGELECKMGWGIKTLQLCDNCNRCCGGPLTDYLSEGLTGESHTMHTTVKKYGQHAHGTSTSRRGRMIFDGCIQVH